MAKLTEVGVASVGYQITIFGEVNFSNGPDRAQGQSVRRDDMKRDKDDSAIHYYVNGQN